LTANGESELLSIVAVIDKGSQHPLASSIVRKAEQLGADLSLSLYDFQSITGKGRQASVRVKQAAEKKRYFCDSLVFFDSNYPARSYYEVTRSLKCTL
jgi:cation transport ATPase